MGDIHLELPGMNLELHEALIELSAEGNQENEGLTKFSRKREKHGVCAL